MAKRTKRTWNRGIEHNILACYNRANDSDRTEGLYWYDIAQGQAEAIASRHGVTVEQAAGVIAALSPGNAWGLNLLDADRAIEYYCAGRSIPRDCGVYGFRNIRKAERILDGENPLDVLGGPKVRAFYKCIVDTKNAENVCIDRHAKCLALDIRENRNAGGQVKPWEFDYLAWHYRVVAARLGLLPHQLQAITWVTWRRLQGQLEQDDLPF